MGDQTSLTRWLGAITGTEVACLGDVMLDRYVYGAVERISPEAPIPVLRVTGEEAMPGAAGNVACNITGLGARCHLMGVIGGDAAGAELSDLLSARPLVNATLIADPRRQTSLKTRYLARSQQLLRADRESAMALEPATAERLLSALTQACAGAGALVLSDYGKGVLSDAVLDQAIGLAREAGLPIVVDPKGRDYGRYRGATVLTPNLRELSDAVGRAVETDEEIVEAGAALARDIGVEAILVTRSERGMTLTPGSGEAAHLRAEAREVFDVSGAGDTVAATVAAALAAGADLVEAARLANAAAGLVVAKVGTAAVRSDELVRALQAVEDPEPAGETQLPEALEQVAGWRRRGLKVGFTNGCFDVLHPGHLSLLRQAREVCDRLVVGLNSDASVRRLKGPDRPVQRASARAEVLSALAMVDLVIVFDDPTPEALLQAVRPDLLVKGADYSKDQVVGAQFVESYGGRVVLADLLAGYSTTRTVERLRNGTAGG
ncbi:MAG: bifunctional D-glycero-beta-D-manno-heptose-7-phosphate kinase/D-glycero-beta-D-manno-heptose 1-phosphate adenylyltransferase HldE [Alphaproteobacteria bacterium]|nr:bifunctional D-glycero-beta-D-manno-heptose-7-phosphate kinase/D-glycero-beta-D-manno-heptose 1-phosphate adenylyltransferase HldE [Alphaproteobacteria bacterium]